MTSWGTRLAALSFAVACGMRVWASPRVWLTYIHVLCNAGVLGSVSSRPDLLVVRLCEGHAHITGPSPNILSMEVRIHALKIFSSDMC